VIDDEIREERSSTYVCLDSSSGGWAPAYTVPFELTAAYTAAMRAAAAAGCRQRRAALRCSGTLVGALVALLTDVQQTHSQRIGCHTSKGVLNIMLHKDWAPEGHTRFMELLESDFFTNQAFYHVERRGPIEFGIAADPAVSRAWRGKVIPDDPARAELQPRRGQLSFQSNAPGRRETRLVISDSRTRTAADYGPFERPFGQVVSERGFLTHQRTMSTEHCMAGAARL